MANEQSSRQAARRPVRRGGVWRWLVCAWLCVAGSAYGGGHVWGGKAADYLKIDPEAVADRVITYQIDLEGMNLFGGKRLSAAQMADMTDGVRQAFVTWNQVLEPIGLQFAEAQAGEAVDLGVRAMPYDKFNPNVGTQDSIAVSMGWPFQRIYTILPIWFDATENLGNLLHTRVVAEHLLSQPYVKMVDSEQYDIYSVALHELGHVLGLGHVGDALRAHEDYNFLGMSTVLLDATCLEPSNWLAGLATNIRRPILETELPTIMIPIRRGTVTTMIPPDDRATAAFLLRHLNPAGADQVLQQAKTLYEQTSPLRFANVAYEIEKNNGAQRNNSLETAMPVLPNQVILGSLFGEDKDGGSRDSDFYRLDLSSQPAGTPVVISISEAGGLLDTGATGLMLQLVDEQSSVVALGHPAGTLLAGSYSTEDPVVTWSLTNPGVYYVLVQQPDDAMPGTYVLHIGVGGAAEPTGQVTPTIDTAGSEGCPTVTPSATACPGLGFAVLSLAGGLVFATGRRTRLLAR